MLFKDQFKDFGELAREHKQLRTHNRGFKEGDQQNTMLMFAEGALILIMLERFLRILPDVEATERDTLFNLLEKAISRQILEIAEKDYFIKQLTIVRNTILHGNYEQAAKQSGQKTIEDYFRNVYPTEIETLYTITNRIVSQIDPNTGRRTAPIAPARTS